MRTRFVLVAVAAMFVVAPVFAQGPSENSGPYVVRGELYGGDTFYFWVINDWSRGYVAIHGIDIVSFCEGGTPAFSWWSFQDTHIPVEEDLVHQLLKGDDVLTSVWPTSIYDYGDPCLGVLDLGAPLAQGTVDVVATDNNLWPWLNDSSRANAWQVSGQGVLAAPDGERMVCSTSVRCVWGTGSDGGGDPGAHCREKVVLN